MMRPGAAGDRSPGALHESDSGRQTNSHIPCATDSLVILASGVADNSSNRIKELAAERLRLLGQTVRIDLIARLQCGPATVSELTAHVGGTQQNVSQHLGLLRKGGVVCRQRRGTQVWYELVDSDVLRVIDHAIASVATQASQLSQMIADRIGADR
jgi:DNA-binding transcriptional ArsR family regulator